MDYSTYDFFGTHTTCMSEKRFEPGDRVRIVYFDRIEEATVVEPTDRFGWVKVEQPYLDDVIQFEAAVEHVERID